MTTDADAARRVLRAYAWLAAGCLLATAVSVAVATMHHAGDRSPRKTERPRQEFVFDSSVDSIATAAEWEAAISQGACIVFVNCDWNIDVVSFRSPFSRLATDARKVAVMVDSDKEDEMWFILQRLWASHHIPSGGLKNYGGAGRVVWFQDGRVVDYDWCQNVPDVMTLRVRTKAAFR